MNHKRLLKLFFSFLLLLNCYSCEKKISHAKINGKTMGTTYNITIPQQENIKLDLKHIQTSVEKKLIALNQSLSTYIESSEISQFNRFKADTWMNVSKDMFLVSQKAQEIAILTDYYFDPTLAPLINLWGFGYTDSIGVPKQSEIDALLPLIGMDKIDIAQNIVYQMRKKSDDIQLDYSAIAKGYAVDQISLLLQDMGYKNHYVEIGGELIVKGFRDAKQQAWKIAVENPQNNEVSKRAVFKTLNLSDMAMATSGDYRNFFMHQGKKYNHTLIPSTGYPSQHKTRSVTVLHKNCMDADAFATGLLAMGYPEAFKLANNLGLAALFIVEKESGNLMAYTSNYLLELEKKNG
ncbi:MAG TPA: FAD:protein FMN transferase [Oligoflexia bacterium]|nr:FAD:protein FMN transferase [Oligoflexia bacterium]HMR24211.1 FAD:protein FMN transferase [Oligoflexia bacterium]